MPVGCGNHLRKAARPRLAAGSRVAPANPLRQLRKIRQIVSHCNTITIPGSDGGARSADKCGKSSRRTNRAKGLRRRIEDWRRLRELRKCWPAHTVANRSVVQIMQEMQLIELGKFSPALAQLSYAAMRNRLCPRSLAGKSAGRRAGDTSPIAGPPHGSGSACGNCAKCRDATRGDATSVACDVAARFTRVTGNSIWQSLGYLLRNFRTRRRSIRCARMTADAIADSAAEYREPPHCERPVIRSVGPGKRQPARGRVHDAARTVIAGVEGVGKGRHPDRGVRRGADIPGLSHVRLELSTALMAQVQETVK